MAVVPNFLCRPAEITTGSGKSWLSPTPIICCPTSLFLHQFSLAAKVTSGHQMLCKSHVRSPGIIASTGNLRPAKINGFIGNHCLHKLSTWRFRKVRKPLTRSAACSRVRAPNLAPTQMQHWKRLPFLYFRRIPPIH